MLHSEPSKQAHSKAESAAAAAKESIAVVPIAIPIVAGPGAITAILISAGKYTGDLFTMAGFSLVCLAYGALFWLCFHFSSRLQAAIGVNGVSIITRLMGMILAAIACIMITNGLKILLPGLA